jgi:signal transduction histidine kinase
MVIENIVDNASKYTEEGKRIAISVKNKRKVVRVIIQDEGVGVAKKLAGELVSKVSAYR